jgi:hypothetical protein
LYSSSNLIKAVVLRLEKAQLREDSTADMGQYGPIAVHPKGYPKHNDLYIKGECWDLPILIVLIRTIAK